MLRCEHAGFNEAVLRMFARRRCTRRERGRERERELTNYISMTERE
jgi:hypothetical protein